MVESGTGGSSSALEWVHVGSLSARAAELEFKGQEAVWCRMWADEVDERNEPVERGIGLAHAMQQKLQGTYNGPGNAGDAVYVCGERKARTAKEPEEAEDEGWLIAPPPRNPERSSFEDGSSFQNGKGKPGRKGRPGGGTQIRAATPPC